MRKDVRTGAIIGGLLIAVLIVYGVVASRHIKKPGDVALVPDKPTPDATTPDGAPTAPDGVATPTSPGDSTPPAAPANPTAPAPTPPGVDVTAPGAGSTPDSGTKSRANWFALLGADDVTSLMPAKTQTPEPSNNDSHSPGGRTPLVAPPSPKHSDSTSVESPTPGGTSTTPDNTTAAPATSSSYVVKSGDTLSSIARAAYGDARLYKRIMEANPKINPNRMRAGTTITLPGKSQLSHDSATTDAVTVPATPSHRSSPKAVASVDSATEYRVVSNDNLYRISMKLYNTPNKVDLIYQFNKDLIGPDPAKLKLNMVLKLPEPPTQTASTR